MTTFITFVLDETGSMMSIKDETINGFNKYLKTIKKDIKGRTAFSLLKFDSSKKEWFVKNESLKNVEPLNEDTYQPGASTPLWDAVAHAIQETESAVKGKKNPTVVFTVLTDGYENASREFTPEQVKTMIAEHDDWAFNFVGVGIDAWAMSNMIGINVGSASFTGRTDIADALAVMAGQTVSYSGGSAAVQTAMRKSFYEGNKNIGKTDDSS